MINVAAFTLGERSPSARFRVRQYIPRLREYAIELTEFVPSIGAFPPRNRLLRVPWFFGALSCRVPGVMRSYKYDLVLLQRFMISTLYTLERFVKKPRILDIDDAVWLTSRFNSIEKLAMMCDGMICGNNFLADYFSKYNKNIAVLPTSVDTGRYQPSCSILDDRKIIGWSGSSSGLKYLYSLENALASVLQQIPEARLRIVCDSKPRFLRIPQDRIDYIKWSSENEVRSIQEMSVGIMPLFDTPWERGKCSFKMLTYMSCGIPVVVSPVGMNTEVLGLGNVGIGASSHADWADSLQLLLHNDSLRSEMGKSGRQVILDYYSLDVIAPKLANNLKMYCSSSK